VQTRWEHLNEDFSLITQLQAFGLNAHFIIEQNGRYAAGFLANFNGTGGVWRKAAIADAGGWQSDTLTEDLDLSYRAQLRGWKFVYRQDIGSPAELPVAMNAVKSQQYRWMKGAAECARKLFIKVLRTPGVSLSMKIHAFYHLFSSASFILVLILGILSVPLIYIRSRHPEWEWVFFIINLFQLNLLILLTFYGVPFWLLEKENKAKLAWYFPMYSSLMMGLALHNTIAVIEGYAGRKTPFVRTPKFNVTASTDSWDANKYVSHKLGWLAIAEGPAGIVFSGWPGFGVLCSRLPNVLPAHYAHGWVRNGVCIFARPRWSSPTRVAVANGERMTETQTPLTFLRVSWLLLSAVGYLYLAYAVPRTQFGLLVGLLAGLFLGYALVLRSLRNSSAPADRFLFASAIGFRLLLFFALPQLSDDVYRFVWDGRLLAHGYNPYLYQPNQLLNTPVAATCGLDESLLRLLNSPSYFTVYPPVNQALFGLAAWLSPESLSGNVIWLRIPIVVCEAGSLWLMVKLLRWLNMHPNLALLYGLNPLVILELTWQFACGGYHDFFCITGRLAARSV
jgi:hypothetical protein